MDRFKFRVWDKYTHETPAEEMQFLCFNGCLVDSDGCHHSPDDYIVEQCTGIKDKNGNLIYEGDIIKYCVNWRAYVLSYIRIVAWDKNTSGFIMLNSTNQVKPLQKWRFPDPDTHIIEIVGNIHKQKEE